MRGDNHTVTLTLPERHGRPPVVVRAYARTDGRTDGQWCRPCMQHHPPVFVKWVPLEPPPRHARATVIQEDVSLQPALTPVALSPPPRRPPACRCAHTRSHTRTHIPTHPPTRQACVRVWNYNKNTADSFRGARRMHVTLDGKALLPPFRPGEAAALPVVGKPRSRVVPGEGFVLRKAPGVALFDFGQVVWLQPPCVAHHPELYRAPVAIADDGTGNSTGSHGHGGAVAAGRGARGGADVVDSVSYDGDEKVVQLAHHHHHDHHHNHHHHHHHQQERDLWQQQQQREVEEAAMELARQARQAHPWQQLGAFATQAQLVLQAVAPPRLLPLVARAGYDTAGLRPKGFVFKLRVYSTINDPYYVGLDGIQFYTFNRSGGGGGGGGGGAVSGEAGDGGDDGDGRGGGGGGNRRGLQRRLEASLQKLERVYREQIVAVWPEVRRLGASYAPLNKLAVVASCPQYVHNMQCTCCFGKTGGTTVVGRTPSARPQLHVGHVPIATRRAPDDMVHVQWMLLVFPSLCAVGSYLFFVVVFFLLFHLVLTGCLACAGFKQVVEAMPRDINVLQRRSIDPLAKDLCVASSVEAGVLVTACGSLRGFDC